MRLFTARNYGNRTSNQGGPCRCTSTSGLVKSLKVRDANALLKKVLQDIKVNDELEEEE